MAPRWLFLALVSPCLAACVGAITALPVVATHITEARTDNSSGAILKRNADEANRIKKLADDGDRYAKIELAKTCFESGYPCLVDEPAEVFRAYSDQGIDIASYYYASYRLGLDPRGYAAERCRDKPCVDREAAAALFVRLSKKGCAYETRAFEKTETIYPCARASRTN